MPRVFVGNFDFEHELATGPRALSRDVQKLAADLVSAWLTVAEAEDVIWSPSGQPTFDFVDLRSLGYQLPRFVSRELELPQGESWELVPWGWTAGLLAWGRSHGWLCPAPRVETVRLINSRIFRWQLEHEFQIALPGSAVLTSVDELITHTHAHVATGASWVLKANFGMAGRERLLGRGPQLGEAVLNWARKRFAQSAGVVFEPWVERISEAGLQWNLPPEGEPQFLGVTPLLTDAAGSYRGSRVTCSAAELDLWKPAVTVTRKVVQRLQSWGYWGPVGIDAMRYRAANGEVRCRPLQDLNVRYTMGRLALGLRRCVAPEYLADWLHDPDLISSSLDAVNGATLSQITPRSWLVKWPIVVDDSAIKTCP